MPTALIVEDEPEANRLLAMLVQLQGYRTDSAFTGGEALEKASNDPPDIVFLDLMLPDINGYEVCKTLKTRKATSLIPIVMVTARVATENRLQSYRVGANDYIPKPYTPDQIFQAMADANTWKRDVERHIAQGEIRLDANDDGESLRKIAQLRCLLLGRTPLDLDSASQIGEVIKEIQKCAEAWGLVHGVAHVAVLSYEVQKNGVCLVLSETTGFLCDVVANDLLGLSGTGPFDHVQPDEGGHRVVLVKSFAPGDSANGQ